MAAAEGGDESDPNEEDGYGLEGDDGETVAAMDVLFPRMAEVVGGGQREERLPVLLENLRSQSTRLRAFPARSSPG